MSEENKHIEEDTTEVTFTIKEQKFINYYMVDFNATQAAIKAGYSEKTARQIGYENLTKPHIKNEIEQRLKEANLGPDATAKMFADIARGNVNNYMRVRKVEHTPRIKKPLAELIKDVDDDIEFEKEYAAAVGLNPKELKAHNEKLEALRRLKIRYEIELRRNPKAFRMVNGETVFVEVAELDLVAISRDKEHAKIKSFKMTKDGPQVELYPADNALDKIAQMHALYKNKLDVTMNGNVDPEKWLEANNTGESAA